MKRAALFFSLLLALLLCACQAAPQEPELPPDALVDYLALSELSPQPVPCTESALADLLPLTVLGNTHETVFTYFQDGQMTISHQLEMQHCVSGCRAALPLLRRPRPRLHPLRLERFEPLDRRLTDPAGQPVRQDLGDYDLPPGGGGSAGLHGG